MIEICKKIAKRIEVLAPVAENGLYEGKAGCCIFLYELYRYTGEQVYGDLADRLLVMITGNMDPQNGLTFANGLFGIGWMLEVLREGDFIDVNETGTMKPIDDVAESMRFFDRSHAYGLLGHGTYLLRRKKSWNKDAIITFDLYTKLFAICDELNDLLAIQIKKIDRYHPSELTGYLSTVVPSSQLYFLSELASTCSFFLRMYKLGIYKEVVSQYIHQFVLVNKILIDFLLSDNFVENLLAKDPKINITRMLIFKLFATLRMITMETAILKAHVNWDALFVNLERVANSLNKQELFPEDVFYLIQTIQSINQDDVCRSQKIKKFKEDLVEYCESLIDSNESYEITCGLSGLSGIGLCILNGISPLSMDYREAWGI